MSLTAVKPYLQARAKESGLHEWKDGFNTDNIPSSVLDKAYHISFDLDQVQHVSRNQYDQEFDWPVTTEIFTKGYKDPAAGIDSAVRIAEDFIKRCVAPATCLTQTSGIKNVTFVSSTSEKLGDSNDNAIKTTIVLRFKVIVRL